MVLVLFGLFFALILVGVGIISSQFHQIVNQAEREKTYNIAEAGIRYGLWELMVAQESANAAQVKGKTVTDPASGATLGTFDLTTQSNKKAETNLVTLTAVGKDAALPSLTQTIVVILQTTDNKTYSIVSWDHQL